MDLNQYAKQKILETQLKQQKIDKNQVILEQYEEEKKSDQGKLQQFEYLIKLKDDKITQLQDQINEKDLEMPSLQEYDKIRTLQDIRQINQVEESNKALPTKIIDFQSQNIKLRDGDDCLLELWETQGLSKIYSSYIENRQQITCVIIVYNIACQMTFQKAEHLIDIVKKEFHKQTLIYLVGNKCDIPKCRSLYDKLQKVLQEDLEEVSQEYFQENLKESLQDSLEGNLVEKLEQNLEEDSKEYLQENLEQDLEDNLKENLEKNLEENQVKKLTKNFQENYENGIVKNYEKNIIGFSKDNKQQHNLSEFVSKLIVEHNRLKDSTRKVLNQQ
ncbi:P-loop containing nucleoside triphosphate hydrolase [Pseudocohnilembus persalinus]|uniref:p-loop containing nucleoside triphosphate hydrolase n=1 Tax=Pseudocohnilembus persalinus TaxID=266149 RepID=A0A0V0QNL7_PSEPJ|nr:P-loop containing nucleoside triphosphate hydrolase [Pseudocohnilembus persalinus]|eukprot:KRX03846.1 P-loop containing nucleoside triphosphate hydrolase [Pseudocohnilembus persalinus]